MEKNEETTLKIKRDMSREIKFRVWDIEAGKYVSGFPVGESIENGFNICGILEGSYTNTDVIIEQYTGLKDKNFVEIYDGDICTDGETKGVVHYEAQAGCYWLKWTVKTMQRTVNRYKDLAYGGQEGSENGIIMTGIEVIGNIHQNPELI